MKKFAPVLFLFLFAACGTDHPFDRGDELPAGNKVTPPTTSVSFAGDVKPVLQACTSCHSGGAGGWVYAGGIESYSAVQNKINLNNAADSELLLKATGGGGHGGGSIFAANSASYQAILNWIEQGAQNN